jgi:uncharacterized protein (DUF433 family)
MVEANGTHVVVDQRICHGSPTFRGTRIFVSDILGDVVRGAPWFVIVNRWGGRVTEVAITEAVCLARDAFVNYAGELVVDPVPE